MTTCDDGMADFLGEMTGIQEPPAAPPPKPRITDERHTDEDLATLHEQWSEKKAPATTQADIEDPATARTSLAAKFPDADPAYLDRIVAEGSRHHVWAMLRDDKADPRVDALIGRFLRQRVITSRERGEVGGNGVDWTYLRDTGLITVKTPDGKGGYLYEIALDNFDATRGARQNLTTKERDILLDAHGRRCNLCGSERDLQADHRVGVAIAGDAAGGDLGCYQTLCRPCNLNKRVACEKCHDDSALEQQAHVETCRTCSWAYPETHTHTAGEPGVRVIFRLKPGTSPVDVARLLREKGLLSE